MLSGWKTYASVAVGCAAVAASYMGYISNDMKLTILAIAGFGGIAGLRSALKGILTDVTGLKLPASEAKTAVSETKPLGWKG